MRAEPSATSPGRVSGLVFCGFVAGAALQLQQPVLQPLGVYAAWLAASLAAALLWVRKPWAGVSLSRAAAAFLMTLVFGFGLTGLRASVFQAGALPPALEGRDIEVTGRVLAMPQRSDDGLRFRFAVESARLDGGPVSLPPRVYLGWYAGFGFREPAADAGGPDNPEVGMNPTAVLALQRQPPSLRAGERWQMTVRLKAPHGNSNPDNTGLLSGYGHS